MQIKNYEINSYNPIICCPIVGITQRDIISQAKELSANNVPMVEWRIDYYEDVFEYDKLIGLLHEISRELTEAVFLVTFRSKAEGGEREANAVEMFNLISRISAERICDLVDIEFDMFEDAATTIDGRKISLDELIDACHSDGTKVILSHHNFNETYSDHMMKNKLNRMYKRQADIVKMALMPKSESDVLRLLSVTDEYAKADFRPIITMSMGEIGRISRCVGRLYGSSVTFAAFSEASAPGQISYNDMKDILSRNIYLIGFMGTGKSTIAAELKRRFSLTVYDTDSIIESRENLSIPEIFEKKGEEYFRKVEAEVLFELSKESNSVISCGGGIILNSDNVKLMKKTGKVVLLTAPVKILLARLKGDDSRPLLQGKKSIKGISGLLDSRQSLYDNAKDIEVDTSASLNKVIWEVVSGVFI